MNSGMNRKTPRSNVNIKGWSWIRKGILDRDNFMCRICGNDEDGLNVHHIDYNRANNDSNNLVTLCGDCHRAVHNENYRPCDHEDWPPPWGEVV